MYIRRKVFSLLEVDGEERYFSTTEFENVNEDEVRLFSDDEKKGMSKKEKAAIAATAAVAATAALVGGGKYGGKKLADNSRKKMAELIENGEFTGEAHKKLTRNIGIGNAIQKPADVITEGAKGAWEGVKRGASKAKKVSEEAYQKAKDATEETVKKVKDKLPKKASGEGK